jgi:hypothetical protein
MTEKFADSAVMARIDRSVAAGGWHIVHTPADETGPAATYSVGLWRNFRHPEVIVLGARDAMAQALIERIANDVRDRRRGFMPETVAGDLLEGAAVTFIAVDETFYEDALEWAVWFYAHHSAPPDVFPAVQAVLPTADGGLYPWDRDYPRALEPVQPLLGIKR